MRGHLTMSQQERQRHLVLDRVVKAELRLSEAVKILGVSYRQGQRLLRRFEEHGAAALVHGLRGRTGTRLTDAVTKSKVIDTYRLNYSDFGPTLASEKLAERDGLTVHPETLRLWLIESGDWTAQKRKSRHRSRRKRRACFGELIQLDGSHHDWFEGRGAKCCLITLVDDATGRTHLRFASDEGTFAVMAALRGWVECYGIPQALYTDRLKTYLTDREPTVSEQLAGEDPLTQFGRACKSLGIRIIAARSPQAKGRVENKHGLTQDRLVKELRLAGIDNINDANKFLVTWLPGINERFAVAPAEVSDMHRPVPGNLNLGDVFCRQDERVIGNDWVVRYNNRYFQIAKQLNLPPSGSTATIREWEDGRIEVLCKERRLRHEELPMRPIRAKVAKAPKPPTQGQSKPKNPWDWHRRSTCDTNPTTAVLQEIVVNYLGEPTEVAAARQSGSR